MRNKVDLILQSFKELTKRKVKRYADIWSTRISELYLVRNHINENQVPLISKCFLTNNLLHDQTVQSILKGLLPQIIDKKGLSVEDYSLMSYVYSCIDEDISSEVILSNNYSEEIIKASSDDDILTFLKTVSLLLSRKTFGKICQDSKTVLEISNNLVDFLWNRIKSTNTKYMSETVEYLAFSELLLESIFISNLVGKLDKDYLNHELLDYGSIFSLIKVSQFLSDEKKEHISNKIYLSDYDSILDTLRKTYYFRLTNFDFTQHLFNRLCNTTGSMDVKDDVLENAHNTETFPSDSKGKLNVKGSEFAIEQMLYILGEYNLAPMPLPSDLVSLWSNTRVDMSKPCDYCSYKNSKFVFPRVEVDLKRRRINVLDLKGLLNLIKNALCGNKDKFSVVYNHFLMVNKLKETDSNELTDENNSNSNSEKNVIFQDLVSMAYSLNIIMSNILNGNDIAMDRSNDANELTNVQCSNFSFDDESSGIRAVISNLSLNFTRRIPSSLRRIVESTVVDNLDQLSVNDIYDLTVSLRMCKSLTDELSKLFLKNLCNRISSSSNNNNNVNKIMLNISLELVEHMLFNKDTKSKNSSELTDDNVDETSGLVDNVVKYLSDNLNLLDKNRLFRMIKVFEDIQERDFSLKKIGRENLDDLTSLILGYQMFVDPKKLSNSFSGIDGNELTDENNSNTNVNSDINTSSKDRDRNNSISLYECNLLVDILRLYLINRKYYCINNNSSSNDTKSERNKDLDKVDNHMVIRLKDYVHDTIYPVIVNNIKRFTSNNIVDMTRIIRKIGEPYPSEVINSICNIYVKHISQYSINNMINLMEELNLMNYRSEKVFLNTLIFLPRKVTSIDSFEHIIKLLQVYKNYHSEYFDILMDQQIRQIYHKINPKYLENLNKLVEK